jgi:hypothetical protein
VNLNLNSGFVAARARGFADRLRRECGEDEGRRVDRAFLLAAGRPPDEAELAAARRFLLTQPGKYAGQAEARERAWTDLCQMLLSSNAFLYVE